MHGSFGELVGHLSTSAVTEVGVAETVAVGVLDDSSPLQPTATIKIPAASSRSMDRKMVLRMVLLHEKQVIPVDEQAAGL